MFYHDVMGTRKECYNSIQPVLCANAQSLINKIVKRKRAAVKSLAFVLSILIFHFFFPFLFFSLNKMKRIKSQKPIVLMKHN